MLCMLRPRCLLTVPIACRRCGIVYHSAQARVDRNGLSFHAVNHTLSCTTGINIFICCTSYLRRFIQQGKLVLNLVSNLCQTSSQPNAPMNDIWAEWIVLR